MHNLSDWVTHMNWVDFVFLVIIVRAIIWFEFNASLPPRRIVALPDLKQNLPIRRDVGTRFINNDDDADGRGNFCSLSPLGRVRSSKILPTGSGSAAISRSPHDMPAMRLSSSFSRSSMAAEKAMLRAEFHVEQVGSFDGFGVLFQR